MAVSEAPGEFKVMPEDMVRPGVTVPALRERDSATWLGLGAAFLLLLSAMAIGGSVPAYVDLPAFLMVFGGTAAVTTVSFSIDAILHLPRILATTLVQGVPRPDAVAMRLLALAEQARKTGLFALENLLPSLRDDRFLVKAAALVVDNTTPENVERLLRIELQATMARHKAAADILRRGGEVAPAMGLIGTLVGLVQMLSNLNNPATIGPAMAVAILATLYGAVLANIVLLPLAAKLDRNNHAEALVANLTIMAAVSIAGHDSPRRLEVMLNSILPPADRITFFD
ncbi:MAG TPA: MotA/TolQ/ExbB proton channel family protein [Aliidongia sp.]|nr:MotA/TolQ/ExbB proton channel family protein [Aliidongia sp.]